MSIASRIETMEQHIEQAYDELQGLGADLTGIDKNIDNIAQVLDDIYDDLPKVTGSGTSITLDDTRKGRLESTLSGNISQETTTGKNKASDVWEEYIQSTGTANYKLYPLTLEEGKTYMLSGVLVGTQKTSYYNFGIVKDGDNYNNFVDPHFAVDYNTGNGQQYTFTVDNSFVSPKLICYVTSKSVFEELFTNYNIQLEEGSSRTSFEPYTNGASPNPSYPQPVNVVSGDNKIVINSKNLFAGGNTTTHNGITFTKNNDGSYNIVGTATSTAYLLNYVPLEESGIINGETYTVSLNQTVQDLELRIESYNGNTWLRATMGGLITFPKTHSADVTGATSVRFGLFVQSGKTVNITNLKIMLEKGSSASSYLPCSRDTYDIDLPVENLFGGVLELGGYSNGRKYNNSDNYRNANIIQVNPNTTYTFSINGTKQKYVIITYGSTQNFKQEILNDTGTFTTASDVYYINFRSYASDFTSDYANLKVQLEKGSKVNSYTPFGTTPIELAEISTYNDEIFRTSGKNLFDNEITPENYYYDNNGEKVYQSGVEYINQEINNVNYTSITISFSSNTGGASVRVCEYNSSGEFITRTLVNTNNQVVNLNNATKKIILSVNSDSNSYFTYLMINKGSSATLYEPYGTGEWYTHKEIGKVVLNGSENITTTTYSAGAYFHNIINIGMNGTNNDYAMSNYYTYSSSYMNNTCKTANGGKELVTRDNFDQSTYITWLGTNKPKFYYLLATPTYTKITYEPLLEQLETIYNAQGYDNQTNISQTNNDLPFIISASALKEWQENTSLNSTLSMVNPLSLGNTLNTQEIENNTQPIEVDNIEPLEEEENEES